MSEYAVDVILPVHSATRPVARAAHSVLDHTRAPVRLNVIAHNINPDVIRGNLGELAEDPRLRLLSHQDGIPSPSGPMNLGLDAATAPYFALLGSDDEFAPGALDSWLRIAKETGASTVLARIERDLQGPDPLPPTRRARTRDLDPVKDRLSYRCAPLGLVSRDRFSGLRFAPGLRSGEDLEFTARLWFLGSHIAYDRAGPAYIGHEDEADRVTGEARPVDQDFAFLELILSSDWFRNLSKAARKALGVKTLRLHYFDAVFARLGSAAEFSQHRNALEDVVSRIERETPGAVGLLSRVDRAVIDEVRSSMPDADRIRELLAARWDGRLSSKLPRNLLLSMHRQAPYRTLRDTRA